MQVDRNEPNCRPHLERGAAQIGGRILAINLRRAQLVNRQAIVGLAKNHTKWEKVG